MHIQHVQQQQTSEWSANGGNEDEDDDDNCSSKLYPLIESTDIISSLMTNSSALNFPLFFQDSNYFFKHAFAKLLDCESNFCYCFHFVHPKINTTQKVEVKIRKLSILL